MHKICEFKHNELLKLFPYIVSNKKCVRKCRQLCEKQEKKNKWKTAQSECETAENWVRNCNNKKSETVKNYLMSCWKQGLMNYRTLSEKLLKTEQKTVF